MTPHEAAAEMRERAQLEFQRGNEAEAFRLIVAADALEAATPDPKDAALEKAREALTDAWETLDIVVDRLNLPGDELEIVPTIIRAKQALAAIDAALKGHAP